MGNVMLSPHFSRDEVACRCCGKIGRYPAKLQRLLDMLEKLRANVGKPIFLTCAYRCPTHNIAVGSFEGSLHTLDQAADCYVNGMSVDALADAARAVGFGGVGRYYEKNFVHVDIGPPADWSE